MYCMKVMNENLLATGDDDGCVKVNVVQVKRISAQICLEGSKIIIPGTYLYSLLI